MITVHEGGKVYRVWLRGAYSHIRSEKKFRELIESGISNQSSPAYAGALRKKSIWEVCRLFGLISKKIQK